MDVGEQDGENQHGGAFRERSEWTSSNAVTGDTALSMKAISRVAVSANVTGNVSMSRKATRLVSK